MSNPCNHCEKDSAVGALNLYHLEWQTKKFMNKETLLEIDGLLYGKLEERVALSMDNDELDAKDFYARREVSKETYGWADYFDEKARVDMADYAGYMKRLARTQTVRVYFKKSALSPQQILDALPAPEKIKRLDLAHNQLSGALNLIRFTHLSYLNLSGNPALNLATSKLPSVLEGIILSGNEQNKLERTDFRQKFPGISISQNGAPAFNLGARPFREPEMIAVKGGKFWMGSGKDAPFEDEKPRHVVQLSDYAIGKYPVTVQEFARFVQETAYVTNVEREGWSVAAFWRGDALEYYCKIGCNWRHDAYGKPFDNMAARRPVVHLCWHDAAAYCRWLSQKTGKTYGLPTEAQWEYAAIGGHKAGTQDEKGRRRAAFAYAGGDTLEEMGWFMGKFWGGSKKDYSLQTTGALKPNELGCYDMSGHVWEWCSDWYDERYYQNQEKKPVENPVGPDRGHFRVLRGGGWYRSARNCRVANRSNYDPAYRNFNTGFRLALLNR